MERIQADLDGLSGKASASGRVRKVSGVYSAEGLTSGAALLFGRCLGAFGLQSTSWYFPIADSLPYYSAVYGVTLW